MRKLLKLSMLAREANHSISQSVYKSVRSCKWWMQFADVLI